MLSWQNKRLRRQGRRRGSRGLFGCGSGGVGLIVLVESLGITYLCKVKYQNVTVCLQVMAVKGNHNRHDHTPEKSARTITPKTHNNEESQDMKGAITVIWLAAFAMNLV